MPIRPIQEFGEANTDPISADYPNGSYKNETVPNVSQDGTPVTAKILNDKLGADEALYADVGITPTNVADTAQNSQKLNALRLLAGKTALRPVLIAQGLTGEYGYFTDGFTYNAVGDVGIDADGNIYTYAGSDPLPVTVAAGTIPNNPPYKQVVYGNTDFDNVNSLTASPVLSKLIGKKVKTNEFHDGEGYGGATYTVYPAHVVNSNGMDVLVGTVDTLAAVVLDIDNEIDISQLGARVGDYDNYAQLNRALTFNTNPDKKITVQLRGREYKVKSGSLTFDTSLTRLNGSGGVIDFSGHANDVEYFMTLTNSDTDRDRSTYENVKSGIENCAFRGLGKNVTTNNNFIKNDTDIGNTVSAAGTTIRKVAISGFNHAVVHLDSSYNITWSSCSIWGNNEALVYVDSSDMFERAVFESCTIFNNNLAFNITARNGVVYLYGCSLDYNTKTVYMNAGGMELHGCHVECDLLSVPQFSVQDNATLNAFGGWWQFKKSELTTALEEFETSFSNGVNTSINDVKFSAFEGDIPFTLTPYNVRLANPIADSDSRLSLKRFSNFNSLFDGVFNEGVITSDTFLEAAGTYVDRYSTSLSSIEVVTNDASNAKVGNNYLKLTKGSGTGSEARIKTRLAVPTGQYKRSFSVSIKSLTGSTSEVYVNMRNLILVDDTTGEVELINRIDQTVTLNLTSSYQDFEIPYPKMIRKGITHLELDINFVNLGQDEEVALDDIVISLIES